MLVRGREKVKVPSPHCILTALTACSSCAVAQRQVRGDSCSGEGRWSKNEGNQRRAGNGIAAAEGQQAAFWIHGNCTPRCNHTPFSIYQREATREAHHTRE